MSEKINNNSAADGICDNRAQGANQFHTDHGAEKPFQESKANAIVVFDNKSRHLISYQPSGNQWQEMQKLHGELDKHYSAVAIDSHIYALKSDRSVYRINVTEKSSAWIKISDRKRNHGRYPSASVFGGKIFAVGAAGAGPMHKKGSDAAEIFDPSFNQWMEIASLKSAKCECAVAATSDHIFCFGRRNWSSSNSAEKFNRVTGKWEEVTQTYRRKGQPSAVELNGIVYMTWTRDETTNTSNEHRAIDRYDPKTNSWTSINVEDSQFESKEFLKLLVVNKKIHGVQESKNRFVGIGLVKSLLANSNMNIQNNHEHTEFFLEIVSGFHFRCVIARLDLEEKSWKEVAERKDVEINPFATVAVIAA